MTYDHIIDPQIGSEWFHNKTQQNRCCKSPHVGRCLHQHYLRTCFTLNSFFLIKTIIVGGIDANIHQSRAVGSGKHIIIELWVKINHASGKVIVPLTTFNTSLNDRQCRFLFCAFVWSERCWKQV